MSLSCPVAENSTETRIWQSQPPYLKTPFAVISSATIEVIARRESVERSPNYFLAAIASDAPTQVKRWTQVTSFPDPYAGLPMPTHQLLHYKRADGVDLTADLYLPAGYTKSQGPLPRSWRPIPPSSKAAQLLARSPAHRTSSPASLLVLPSSSQPPATPFSPTLPSPSSAKAQPNPTTPTSSNLSTAPKPPSKPVQPRALLIPSASASWATPMAPL